MKCDLLNMDRAQLLSLGAADAEMYLPHSGTALHLDSTAPASGPAAITETPLSNGARAAMIVRRASRLRFPNEIQRQRYIQRHSLACSGDA